MFGLRAGASGLNSYGEAMSVVGSNISNVNTVGYKSNRVNFQDMLATNVRGTATKIGKGVTISSVQADFSSGSMESSTQTTDLAIEGDGFFTVKNDLGKTYYTRAGNFEFNDKGVLVTVNDEKVMVREVDSLTGDTTGLPKEASIIGMQDAPIPTGDGDNGTGVQIMANLNADADIPEFQFDPTNVQSDMYNFSQSVTVIDERGGEHVMDIVFRKVPDSPPLFDPATGQQIPGTARKNQWQWFSVVNARDVGGQEDRQIAVGGGFLRFAERGRLIEATNGVFLPPGPAQIGPNGQLIPPGPPQLVEAPLAPGATTPQATVFFTENPQTIGLNFGTGSNENDPNDERTGLEGVTQFASEFHVTKLVADGQRPGTLENFEVGGDGTITGYFDNGTIRPLYKLYMTRFVNNPGLVRAGDNRFQESKDSGKAMNGNAAEGNFGVVRSRNLEKSNVDLSSEFVSMIENQRAFQANAKIISTGDEMMADLVNMKR